MKNKSKYICGTLSVIMVLLLLPILFHKYTDIFTFSIDKIDLISYSSLLVSIISISVVIFLAYLGLDHLLRLNKMYGYIDEKKEMINSLTNKNNRIFKKNKKEIIEIKEKVERTYKFDYNIVDIIFDTLTGTFYELNKQNPNHLYERLRFFVYENQLISNTYYNEFSQKWDAIMGLKARSSELINREKAIVRLENIWNNKNECDEIRRIALLALTEIRSNN